MKKAVIFILMSVVFLFTISCGKSDKNKNSNSKKTEPSNKKRCFKNKHTPEASVILDDRCIKIRYKAIDKGQETGVCYDGPLVRGIDKGADHPDPEACKALLAEAQKKCDALPPDPKFQKPVSRTEIYKDGELVSVNGEPVSKGLPDCDECKDCEPID